MNPLYTLTAYSRFQLNDFYEVTERLPEIALDIKRQPVFDSPVFYEGESSFSSLRRSFATDSPFRRYETLRFDTFSQFLYPKTYLGWLSVVPRVGFRATYYSQSRDVSDIVFRPSNDPLIPEFLLPPPSVDMPLQPGGDRLRTVVNAGIEASFKEVSALPGGDRCPQDRRQHRLESEQITDDATLHQPLEVRHPAGVHQWMDQLPIGCIPPDEEKLLRDGFRHDGETCSENKNRARTKHVGGSAVKLLRVASR